MSEHSVADAPQGGRMSDYYWHFTQVDDNGTPRLGYKDNREVRVGETLTVDGEPVLCERGLHASATLWDSINAKRGYPWGSNPWAWVIEFKRIAP